PSKTLLFPQLARPYPGLGPRPQSVSSRHPSPLQVVDARFLSVRRILPAGYSPKFPSVLLSSLGVRGDAGPDKVTPAVSEGRRWTSVGPAPIQPSHVEVRAQVSA